MASKHGRRAAADGPLMAAGAMSFAASTGVAFLNETLVNDVLTSSESTGAAATYRIDAAAGSIDLGRAGSAPRGLKAASAIFSITHTQADGQLPKLVAEPVGQETAQALREAREELRRFSALLVSIQEDERRRIALDLHDGLGQSLSLIKLSIEQSAKLLAEGSAMKASESLRQLTPRVEEALAELRRVSTELRPLMLDDLGLLPTLSWFFREFDAVCSGVVLEKTIDVAEYEVPVALHITLYRILQEAFHNIVKHAVADRVRVRLDRSGDALHLVIEDNGRGFDPATVKWEGQTRGLGLLSMKERASLSGGTYHLNSAPGKGTCIRVSWPSGICPASINPCRASECIGPQLPCRRIRTANDGDQKNTVHRV